MRLKVMGLPAFLMYRDGEEIGRIGGNDVNMDVLRSWVDETLAGLAPQRG
jgi:hypothetical protein